MDSPATVIFPLMTLVLWMCLAYGLFKLRTRRAKQVVERWAGQNGFRIDHLQPRLFPCEPFLPHGIAQLVFRIGVRDREKQPMTGWLLVGHFFLGQFVDRVRVSWDKSPASLARPSRSVAKAAPMWDHEIDAADEQVWNV